MSNKRASLYFLMICRINHDLSLLMKTAKCTMSVSIWAQVFHFWSIDVCLQKPVACSELITTCCIHCVPSCFVYTGEMGANLSTHGAITLRLKRERADNLPKAAAEPSRSRSIDNEQDSSDRDSGVQNFSSHRKGRSPSKHRRIVLNVSGFRYMTYLRTLERFPSTLLGNKEKRDQFYDEIRDEYFFDRNIQVFELILYFYQSNGRLVCPPELAPEILLEEVEFFELGQQAINAVKDILNEDEPPEREIILPKNRAQKFIWRLFECPDSSKAARVLALLSVSVIVASIVVLCIETLPEFTVLPGDNIPANDTAKQQELREHNDYAHSVKAVFGLLEIAFISWFTFEYLVRLIASPQKWLFVRSFLNVIDLLAILPFYVELALKSSGDSQNFSLAFLRILRLVRVFRIFKLSRHSSGLQILGLTLKKSLRELGLLIFFLIIGIVIFSSMVYYAENGEEDTFFTSIPDAFWWALVTMTTVGYGDMYPKTLWGKLVGSGCALCGVLAIALPVPVIVSNFDTIYKKYRSRKLKQQGTDGENDRDRKVSLLFGSRKSSELDNPIDSPDSPGMELKELSKGDLTEDKRNGNVIQQEEGEEAIESVPEKAGLTNGQKRQSQDKNLNVDCANPSEIVSLLEEEESSFAKLNQTNV